MLITSHILEKEAEELESTPIKSIKLPKQRNKVGKQLKGLTESKTKTNLTLKYSSEFPAPLNSL